MRVLRRSTRCLGLVDVTRWYIPDEGGRHGTTYALVIMVPFTQTRVSAQLQLVIFDEP